MNASEIIQQLQDLIDQHGDGPVQTSMDVDGEVWYSPVYRVEAQPNMLYPFLLSGEFHENKNPTVH